MEVNWQSALRRWLGAGVVDAVTAERIRAYEAERESEQGFRWPVIIAWTLGGIMVCAGVLLFVAAHWDDISPAQRFVLVLGMVAVFHVASSLLVTRVEALARVLAFVGTVSLGAGIALTGQIFNLQEHWPGGIMLWALGAVVAWAVLGWWEQGVLVAVLIPWWLGGEWLVATQPYPHNERVLASGLALFSIVYFTARYRGAESYLRQALTWLGGIMLVPSVLFLAVIRDHPWARDKDIPAELSLVGWAVAILLPLALGNLLRKRIAVEYLAAAAGVILLTTTTLIARDEQNLFLYAWGEIGPYLVCAAGSVAMVWWGLKEARRERINMGLAGFGVTVLSFYFSSVMDKLGRAGAMFWLGVLFLVLGWSLMRARKRLLTMMEKAES